MAKIETLKLLVLIFTISILGCISARFPEKLVSIKDQIEIRIAENDCLSEFGDTIAFEIVNISDKLLGINTYALSFGPIRNMNGTVQQPKTPVCMPLGLSEQPMVLGKDESIELKLYLNYLYFYDLDSIQTWSISVIYENNCKKVGDLNVIKGFCESNLMHFKVCEKVEIL